MARYPYRLISATLIITVILCISCSNPSGKHDGSSGSHPDSLHEQSEIGFTPACASLVSPENPLPGDTFRIISTGGKEILKAEITVLGPSGQIKPLKTRSGGTIPSWRVDEFRTEIAGEYSVKGLTGNDKLPSLKFHIGGDRHEKSGTGFLLRPEGWTPAMEELYSAWISALFDGYGEDRSWKSLHEVTQKKENNFLYNFLSRGEDDPGRKGSVVMQPDCADNPYFFRAYFAWKLGLPFGFHICDRGYLGKSPSTGAWVTATSPVPGPVPVSSFNVFLRKVMNGVHSGSARTALNNNSSDYYPVALNHNSIRPGVVYADPYGHTFVIVRWIPQSRKQPGILLAVDAQPDGTIAIKRFWKGNFLFNTKEVVGEPGFKAFRPIVPDQGSWGLLKNNALTESSGFVPFSTEQLNLEPETFYHKMEQLINPEPMDPENALTGLINALHEQLQVRVNSVANGEAWFKAHPGGVIPMPGSANGLFQTGGDWENYSTPNRDLRLLIAIDAVLQFPEQVARFPEDYKISGLSSTTKIQEKLQKSLLNQVEKLSFDYTRSDGSTWPLTLKEILDRREAFEMGWNPNDGPEIRWGAPEGSEERSTCKRKAPAAQLEKMKSFRKWFQQRLHPPT